MQRQLLSSAIIGASLLFAGQAFAAGYYVDEQSALRLGDAFSGGSASASDASAAYYGPASLILVPDQLVVNVAALPVTTKFTGDAYSLDSTGSGIQPINGGSAKTSTVDVLPTLYFSKRLDEDLVLGAYINAPYATGSEFGKTSKVRYQAADSEITGIDLGVSFAARVHEKVALGGGLIMQYMKAKTGVAVNTFPACLAGENAQQLPTGACQTLLLAANIGTTSDDGYFEMEGHNTAMGFQLGALVEFTDHSRLGVNYRSKISHSLTGNATAEFPTNAFTDLAGLTGTTKADGRADITTPETASISYFHEIGQLALQADVSWTNWSRFDELKVNSSNPIIKDLTKNPQQYDWEETYRLAVGANYKLNEQLTVRGGFAFDKSPIADDKAKADFAFDDYKALSLGMSYGFTNSLFLDAGVQHTLKQERNVKNNELTTSGSLIDGKVTTDVTTLALGLRWLL